MFMLGESRHWRVGGSVWPVNASLFHYGIDCRKCLLFSVQEGGQTEWRWVGRDGMFGRCVRERNDKCWLVRSRMHPIRGAGLGSKKRCGGVSQAVRPAGNIGCGILITRRCLLRMVNLLRTGMRQGLKRKWTAVCGILNPPWPPYRGESPKNRGRFRPDIAAESPTARCF